MSGGPWGARRRRFAGAAVVSALLLLLPAALAFHASGIGVSSRPLVVHTAAGTSVTMSVGSNNQFIFTPNDISNVVPGSNVTIVITNLGDVPHTFTLSSLDNYTLPYSGNVNLTSDFLVAHPPLVNKNISGTSGAQVTVQFTAPPKIGSYQFFCTQTGHFAAGMEGFLGVGISVGPPPAPPGVGDAVFIISGVIVGLVILAIILGFVVGRREGATHEMPPERLGYPETAPDALSPRTPH